MTKQPLIVWQDAFAVGIPAVDHEHQEMVALINDLYDNIDFADKDAVGQFLGKVYSGIAAHFALEEKTMRDRGYDQLEDHKADHERLLDEIGDIIDTYEADGFFSKEEFSARLAAWFTVHFKTKDARLHRRLG